MNSSYLKSVCISQILRITLKKDSLIDKEAFNRATTVCLVQKNIPMLPRVLSEDKCSLLPGVDRLAITCTFRIYLTTGALDQSFKPQFALSVVNSKAKWNYDLVQQIIDNNIPAYNELNVEDGTKPQDEETYKQMITSVQLLHKLTSLVRKQRFESGSLMISNESVHFTFNDKDEVPSGFVIDTKHESHHLIEELMLIANKFCAEFLYEHMKDYALIRRHPYLNDNKFIEIQRYLVSNKITVDFEDPQELNKMLLELREKNQNKFLCIQHKLKTFMLRAEYVLAKQFEYDDLKHYALNFELYTHFTSPIRRYPDLIVHRQLKAILATLATAHSDQQQQQQEEHEQLFKKQFDCYEDKIEHFNERYNNSKQISQKSQRLYQCLYLRTQNEMHCKGLIMDITGKNNKRINLSDSNDLVVTLFVPELNMELEWKKEYNSNVIAVRFDKGDNELNIDYKVGDTVENKTIRTFDAVDVIVSCMDSIPIDVKCVLKLQ